MELLKKKGNRYYRYSWNQFRSFPIKKVDAELLLASGEAELVEYFPNEPTPENVEVTVNEINNEETTQDDKNNNIVSFAELKAKKEEQKEIEKVKNNFLQNILPKLTKLDMKYIYELMHSNDEEKLTTEFMRLVMRVEIENMVNDK